MILLDPRGKYVDLSGKEMVNGFDEDHQIRLELFYKYLYSLEFI